MTMRKWATVALGVQDASNLSGIVHSMSKLVSFLCRQESTDTNYVNTHPTVVLFTAQLLWLASGSIYPESSPEKISYTKAHQWCTDTVEKVA